MEERVLVTRKSLMKNKELRKIRKQTLKGNRKVRGSYPKAKIGKLAVLKETQNYYDFSEEHMGEEILEQGSGEMTYESFNRLLTEKEICGFSGSAFPTGKKVETVKNSNAQEKYLVINAVACDPGLLQDEWLLKNHLSEIEKGIALLQKMISFKEIHLATKIELEKKTEAMPYTITRVPDRYPMGEERILLQRVLGVTFEKEEIPAENGYLIMNVQTVYAIYRAAYGGCRANEKLITVAELESGKAVIARVRLGMKVSEIIETIYGKTGSSIYYGGGIMSGKEAGADASVTAKTNFIGVGTINDFTNEARCKGCGACSANCPMQIKVHKIVRAVEKNDLQKARTYQPEKCIQCGGCSYQCAAGKNIMEIIAEL